MKRFIRKYKTTINHCATAVLTMLSMVGIADLAGWISVDEMSQKTKLTIGLTVMVLKSITSLVVNLTKQPDGNTPPL